MSEFRSIFEAYGGDYQATMARFVNKEDMYLKFLDMLFKDDNMQKLGDALDEGDMKGAFEAAHTLKGVVGNMGLTPLFSSVCTILEPLRAREERSDYLEMYDVIKKEFQKADDLRANLKKGE